MTTANQTDCAIDAAIKTDTCHVIHTDNTINAEPTNTNANQHNKSHESDELKQTQTEWACAICTFLNSDQNVRCEICINPKYNENTTPTDTGTPEKNTWRCKSCTLINNNFNTTCNVCGRTKHESNTSQHSVRDSTERKDFYDSYLHDYSGTPYSGTPTLSSMDTLSECGNIIPPLEPDPSELRDWRCKNCREMNASDSTQCYHCYELKYDSRPETSASKLKTRNVYDVAANVLQDRADIDDEIFMYNTLSHLNKYEQQCLVDGFVRKYSGITEKHGLWKQTILFCFGCYLGCDELLFIKHRKGYSLRGFVQTKECYIYSWKLKITANYAGFSIGIQNNSDVMKLTYSIDEDGKIKDGSRYVNDIYCKELAEGDVVTVKYNKKESTLGYDVNDKWYGVAFYNVINADYSLIVHLEYGVDTGSPCIELLSHHWTSQ